MLVVDQFEECFTMCQDEEERDQFFACLLEMVAQSNNKFCLVLGMRADFLGKCAEYKQLADKIDQHLVTVKPMTSEEIEEAIIKPGELVGLQVEQALVTKMTGDVVDSPGSLPLLQYTLTELWTEAQTSPNPNRLTLDSYNRLGGIEKTLPKRANQVYQSLKKEEKPVAKRIFLELTQLGETSDTRRRVCKEDLVNSNHSLELLNRTIEQLVKAKLIVTTNESKSCNGKAGVILDIVHEALIRHWQELRQWVEKHQVAMEKERRIEARAKEWKSQNKNADFLLQGTVLTEAEAYLEEYRDLGLLDGIAQEFIEVSQKYRTRLEKAEQERQERELKAAQSKNQILVSLLGVVSVFAVAAFVLWQIARRQETMATVREQAAVSTNLLSLTPLESLIRVIQATGESKSSLDKVLPEVKSSLYEVISVSRERNQLKGHQGTVFSVAWSADGNSIVSGGEDGTVRLWQGGNWETWLEIGCESLIDHPVLVEPETMFDENEEMMEVAQEAGKTCQELVWKSDQKAHFLVNQGRAVAQAGNFQGAMNKFQEAQKFSPNIEVPSEAEVGSWAAPALVEEGKNLAREGKVTKAITKYQQAQKLDSTLEIDADSWNTLCAYGSLHGDAAKVMDACEKAVALEPENKIYQLYRGLARALAGNKAGAIEDFQASVKSNGLPLEKERVQGWIDALQAGKNPFTKEEIDSLLKE